MSLRPWAHDLFGNLARNSTGTLSSMMERNRVKEVRWGGPTRLSVHGWVEIYQDVPEIFPDSLPHNASMVILFSIVDWLRVLALSYILASHIALTYSDLSASVIRISCHPAERIQVSPGAKLRPTATLHSTRSSGTLPMENSSPEPQIICQ